MAIDSDNPVSLPTPPPPRPAARREAIDAAMRKFDGVEDAPRKQPAASWWTSNRRQFGALATAVVIAVISVPVAVMVLQNQPKPTPQARAPTIPTPSLSAPPAANVAPADTSPVEAEAAEVPRSKLPLEPHGEAAPLQVSEERKAINEAPALSGLAAAPAAPAAAPPPPPPPPPPAPAPERDEAASMETGSEIITTGSRIAQAPPSTQHGRLAAKRAADAASPVAAVDVYGKFLPRLQSAIRSDNRRAVTAMIQFPLRVNTSAGPRTYRDRKSVEDDFDRIFTPRVRKAILDQRADQLFVRDQGAMVGDGEVWFDQTCRNSDCSQLGPVRIKAVNP